MENDTLTLSEPADQEPPAFHVIRWIKQRGIGTYDIGWACL
jgi:hypothetical protein